MLFNTFNFIAFFAIVLVAYYALSGKLWRLRWVLLLGASLIFYMAWRAELVLLLLFSTAVNFAAAHWIQNGKESARKWILRACLIMDFGLLFVFKYLVFANDTMIALFPDAGLRPFTIILPMGISFYTFQAVGYVIDVYRGKIEPEPNYLKFTLFITFFPQLVAGPIERAGDILPQLFEKHDFKLDNLVTGVQIMLWGFFKKMVIADRAAAIVNMVYAEPRYFSFIWYLFAAVLFAFQLYCDFSGYSDIALGAARCLGIKLTRNFNAPYFSTDTRVFWRRWHITLSGWFRDYVYIPLGGNRHGKLRQYLNLMVTFLLSGLWHGANWTFVIWGGLNGLFQIIGHVKDKLTHGVTKRFKILNPLRVLFVFGLYAFSLIFLRANTLNDAWYIITHFFWGFRDAFTPLIIYNEVVSSNMNMFSIFVLLCAIVFMLVVEFFERGQPISEHLRGKTMLSATFYAAVLVAILSLGVFYGGGAFIYFQF